MDENSDRLPETNQYPASTDGGRKRRLCSKRSLILLTAGALAAVAVGWRWWRVPGVSDKSSIRPPALSSSVVDDEPLRPQTHAQLAEEARQFAERLVESFPADPQAIEIKAQLLYTLGDFSAAGECWQRCLELDPRYAFAHSGLGVIAAKQADFETAAAHHRKALEFAPEGVEHALGLADALIKLNNADEAVAVIEDYLKHNDGTIAIHSLLGRAYLQTREHEKAKDAFREVLQRDPEDIAGQFGFASALARLGQRDEAEREMAKLRELRAKKKESSVARRESFNDLAASCRDMSVKYSWMGRVYLAHEKAPDAERLWLRAAKLDPNATECRMHLASLYQRTDRGRQALQMCRQLTEIAPQNPYFHRNLGTMCGNLNLFDDAETAFREAIRLAPQNAEGYSSLARLYLRSGRQLADAVGLARAAVGLVPSEPNYLLLRDACSSCGDRAGDKAAAIQKGMKH